MLELVQSVPDISSLVDFEGRNLPLLSIDGSCYQLTD
jgi:hypothetical protein